MNAFHNWGHTRNPFSYSTRRSFPKLYTLATDHLSKLSARISNVDIDYLHKRFQPFYEAFKSAYQNWDRAHNRSIAYTMRVEQLLEELYSDKLTKWDAFLQYALGSKSPAYTELMHGGRTAFRRGKKDIRIKRVENLALAVQTHPALSLIAQEVAHFANRLLASRDAQKQWEQEKRHTSGVLHEQHEILCRELFRNLGSLIALHPDKPHRVMEFFQMELVRSKSKTSQSSNSVAHPQPTTEVPEIELKPNTNKQPDKEETPLTEPPKLPETSPEERTLGEETCKEEILYTNVQEESPVIQNIQEITLAVCPKDNTVLVSRKNKGDPQTPLIL